MRVPEKESQPIPPTQQLSGSALRQHRCAVILTTRLLRILRLTDTWCGVGLEVTVMANSSALPGPESRYTRVKAILDAAANGSPSDYGGLGRFWDLPLQALIEAKVYGVRL